MILDPTEKAADLVSKFGKKLAPQVVAEIMEEIDTYNLLDKTILEEGGKFSTNRVFYTEVLRIITKTIE